MSLPAGELKFIVKFLYALGCDVQYYRQVVPEWWRWPVDFWNYELDIFIQIDGHCHWYGMHRCTSRQVQQRDMKFHCEAYVHNARVLRVHTADICKSVQVQAAIAAAVVGYKIVLSPSYGSQCMNLWGSGLKYVAVAQQQLPQCCNVQDVHGNTLICSS